MNKNKINCIFCEKSKSLFWIIAVMITAYCLFFSFFMQGGEYFSSFFSKDFLFNLEIAKNFSDTFLLTFDRIQETSGFSLFWLLFLSPLFYIFGTNVQIILILSKLLIFFLSLITLFFFKKNISKLFNLKEASLYCVCLFFYFGFLKIAVYGFNNFISITFFLVFISVFYDFLETQKNKKLFIAFLYASFSMIFAFDFTLFYICLIATIFISDNKYELRNFKKICCLKNIPYIALGLLPFILYIAFNYYKFGTIIPSNYEYMFLKADFSLNTNMFYQLLVLPFKMYLKNPVLFSFSTIPFFILLATFIGISVFYNKLKPSNSEIILTSAIVFPVFYYICYSLLSHWKITNSMLYPIIIASSFALGKIFSIADEKFSSPKEIIGLCFAKSFFIFYFLCIILIAFTNPLVSKTSTSYLQKIAKNTKSNQIYAIGQFASRLAFFSNAKIFASQGNVSSKKHLKLIEKQENLETIFSQFSVDYYIAIAPKEKNGCYFVEEPQEKIAGRRSRRSSRWICNKPEKNIKIGSSNILIFDTKKL